MKSFRKYIIPFALVATALFIVVYVFLPSINKDIQDNTTDARSEMEQKLDSAIVAQNETSITQGEKRGSYSFIAERDGQSAFDLLKKYVQVEYKEYDMGIMVEGINGVSADKQNFWAFYVNGEFASSSVDKTILKKGDVVELVYERVEMFKNL